LNERINACGAVTPEQPEPHAHRHVCVEPPAHDQEGCTHFCSCGYNWIELSQQDQALLAALAEQLNALRLAGLQVSNVDVNVETGTMFRLDKRRIYITAELVPVEAEEPR
jgi:hypothetical protein